MLPAYIYSRISSKQQTSGVGLDRQLENAKAYCQANNLEIVDIQADVASAFHSKHIDGNLGAFLDAIKGNLIPVPSALVVESLDRLGREHELTALSRFIDIVKAGVEIHEISTGIVYNIADTHLLHVALSIMTRAYNESSIKSKRATDAIQRKIEDARKTNKVIGANIPAWIDNIDGKFHLNKHAETVKRIYDLYISGMTIRPIVRHLIEQNVEYPVPKIAKKGVNAGTYQWHSGRIMTILSSSCVYGTYTPKNGEPIEDYYPAVVDLATFMKVKDIREGRARKAVKVNDLLSIFGSCCQCNSCKHTYISNQRILRNRTGEVKTVAMRCNGRLAGLDCDGVNVPNEDLEAYVLPLLPEIDISKLNRNKMRTLDTLKARLALNTEQQDNLLDIVQMGNAKAKERFMALSADIEKLQEKIAKMETRIVPAVDLDIQDALNQENIELRRKLNTQLCMMGLKIIIDCKQTGKAEVQVYLKSSHIHTGVMQWTRKNRVGVKNTTEVED
ncbi:recombinase family protein [Aeromonas allosaccharophila]|uniref:recombinase family protein n=1 Tax=Aeromonas allosaccharophila TaxID=656 RepID=UPI001F389DA6|nr:recombinase family protein [Aeromonas allosaccharophila]MCE9849673.1 recombinase family protein [Aeromonas allosaccharophila]